MSPDAMLLMNNSIRFSCLIILWIVIRLQQLIFVIVDVKMLDVLASKRRHGDDIHG